MPPLPPNRLPTGRPVAERQTRSTSPPAAAFGNERLAVAWRNTGPRKACTESAIMDDPSAPINRYLRAKVDTPSRSGVASSPQSPGGWQSSGCRPSCRHDSSRADVAAKIVVQVPAQVHIVQAFLSAAAMASKEKPPGATWWTGGCDDFASSPVARPMPERGAARQGSGHACNPDEPN